MILAISSREIGTRNHLIFDGEDWAWSSRPPKDSLLWGFDHPLDLRDAAASLNIDIPTFWNTPWGKAQSKIQCIDKPVRWQHTMPKSSWKMNVENIVDKLWMNFSEKSNSYYIDTHLRNRKVVWQLSRPIVSHHLYADRISKTNSGSLGSLEKFRPMEDGKSKRSEYAFSRTVTGRMTIVNGPNILTLKKENRSIFKSRFPNGKIVEIDLQSAEPRVALSLFGKSIDGDIYKHVMKSIDSNITRDAAKIATISSLYGASQHSLRAHISNNSDAIKVLESVKSYFGVRHLEKMIAEQHLNTGYITNTHGRKIFSDAASVNHLIQSSTVDVAFDVFESLLLSISKMKIEAIPLYIIHDAIILDVSQASFEDLSKLCSNGFISKTVKTNFPVKIKEIN